MEENRLPGPRPHNENQGPAAMNGRGRDFQTDVFTQNRFQNCVDDSGHPNCLPALLYEKARQTRPRDLVTKEIAPQGLVRYPARGNALPGADVGARAGRLRVLPHLAKPPFLGPVAFLALGGRELTCASERSTHGSASSGVSCQDSGINP